MHRRAKRRSLNISRPDRNPIARRDFDQLDNRNGYAIIHRVQDAKKPETRAQRIEKYVTMLGRGKRIYPTK